MFRTLALVMALMAPPPTTSPPDVVALENAKPNATSIVIEQARPTEVIVSRVNVLEVTYRLDRAPSAEVVSVLFLPRRDSLTVKLFDMTLADNPIRRLSTTPRRDLNLTLRQLSAARGEPRHRPSTMPTSRLTSRQV